MAWGLVGWGLGGGDASNQPGIVCSQGGRKKEGGRR